MLPLGKAAEHGRQMGRRVLYTPAVQRSRWIVFALLNASWITCGLVCWGTFTLLSHLFSGWGMRGPDYDIPVLILNGLLSLGLGLGVPFWLFTGRINQLRPDLTQGPLAIIGFIYVVLSLFEHSGDQFLPVRLGTSVLSTYLLLAALIGLTRSWWLSRPPRTRTDQHSESRVGRLGSWWARVPSWAQVVLVFVAVQALLSTSRVAVGRLTAGRTEVFHGVGTIDIRRFSSPSERVDYAQPSPDGRLVAVTVQLSTSHERIILVDAGTQRRLWQVEVGAQDAKPLWLVDPSHLLIQPGRNDQDAFVLSVATGQVLKRSPYRRDLCQVEACVQPTTGVLPGGQRVTAMHDFNAKGAWLRDRAGHQVGARFVRPQSSQSTMSVALSPNGRRIGVGYNDGTFMVFDTVTRHALAQWKPHTGSVYQMVWSPTSQELATYGEADCGGLSRTYCVIVSRFPDKGPISAAVWRLGRIDLSVSLAWIGAGRLLLDDNNADAFTVRVPQL